MSRSIYVDTSILPSNIFNFHDDQFYSIVGQLAGSEEAQLMKVQSIRSVNSFLRIENIFDVLSIDSVEITSIKRNICFFLNDDSYLIKPGIKASIQYLRDLFMKKQREMYINPRREHSNIHTTDSMQTSTTSASPVQLNSTTIDINDHRSFLIKAIDEWCSRNSHSFGIADLKLIESLDFFISDPPINGDFIHIRCGCRILAKLPRQGGHFQLSNYYRHLKTGKCSIIQSKLQASSGAVHPSIDIDGEEHQLSQQSLTPQIDQTSSSSTTDALFQPKRKRNVELASKKRKHR